MDHAGKQINKHVDAATIDRASLESEPGIMITTSVKRTIGRKGNVRKHAQQRTEIGG
jgi:hypothetical protein